MLGSAQGCTERDTVGHCLVTPALRVAVRPGDQRRRLWAGALDGVEKSICVLHKEAYWVGAGGAAAGVGHCSEGPCRQPVQNWAAPWQQGSLHFLALCLRGLGAERQKRGACVKDPFTSGLVPDVTGEAPEGLLLPSAAQRSPLRLFRKDLGSVVLFLMGLASFQKKKQDG